MPPEDESQPTEDEIATVIEQLDSRIREGRTARMAARPPVAHYRLSRREYQNTVYDLLGVRYDPTKPGELNADPLWHGFERIGSQLSLSPSHVERYYHAAEIVLDRAFPEAPIETQTIRKTAADIRMAWTAGSPPSRKPRKNPHWAAAGFRSSSTCRLFWRAFVRDALSAFVLRTGPMLNRPLKSESATMRTAGQARTFS